MIVWTEECFGSLHENCKSHCASDVACRCLCHFHDAELTALRQRYEKLRALGQSMLDAYHGDDDLGPAFEALDDALAADEGEVEPPDGQY